MVNFSPENEKERESHPKEGEKTHRKTKKVPIRISKRKVNLKLDEHRIPLDELCGRFNTNPIIGLSEEQAKLNLKNFGPNILSPPSTSNPIFRYMIHILHGLSGISWIGTITCWFTYFIETCANQTADPNIENVYLGCVMALFVFITGTVSYVVEWKAGRFLRSIKDRIQHFTVVIRNAERKFINVEDVVVGDLIVIKAGDRIPADIRVIKARNFRVNKFSITGEKVPANISNRCTSDNPLLTQNLIFMSTMALEGTCQGIVFAVGDKSVVGHVERHVSILSQIQTNLSKHMTRIILVYSIIGMFVSLAFCILFMRDGLTWLEITLILVAMYVACVPEQLLMIATAMLTHTGKQMRKHNCMPKSFHAIEALGSTTHIIVDKTGILTQNEMRVSHLWVGEIILPVDTELFQLVDCDDGYKALYRCMALCVKPWEEASIASIPVPKTNTQLLQMALLKFVKEVVNHSGYDQWSKSDTLVHEVAFNTVSKHYLAIHKSDGHTRQLAIMMGAPEAVLSHCIEITIGCNKYPITDDIRDEFKATCEEMADYGEIIFGFADMFLEEPYKEGDHLHHKHGFRFLGLISIANPIRPSVPNAIGRCRSASIRVMMITRSDPSTAMTIARNAGIITGYMSGLMITGERLHNIKPEELDELILQHGQHGIVFADTSPHHKFLIVQSCHRIGGRTIVTGDAVMDCPALKAADIGIAPLNGSDIVKQASDMILLDNSFAAIVDGIEEGRLIYQNLVKCITYTTTALLPLLAPFLFFMFLRIPRPLGAFAILIVIGLTALLSGVSFCYERAEYDLMKRPAKDLKSYKLFRAEILRRSYFQIGFLEVLAGMFAYAIVLIDNGFNPLLMISSVKKWDSRNENNYADSFGQQWTYFQRKELEFTCHAAYFFAVIATQVANLLMCKVRSASIFQQGMKNWHMNAAIVVALIAGILFSLLPSGHMEKALKLRSLSSYRWFLPPLPFVLFIMVYEEIRRYIIRKFPNGWVRDEFHY